MTVSPFAALFLAVLTGVTIARLWLAARQKAHLRSHRGRVPTPFRDRFSVDDHARATDYQLARLRLGRAEVVAGALLLLALTWGSGVDAVAGLLQEHVNGLLAAGTLAVVAVAGLTGLLDLIFAAWRTFRVEARFGFNRASPGLSLSIASNRRSSAGWCRPCWARRFWPS